MFCYGSKKRVNAGWRGGSLRGFEIRQSCIDPSYLRDCRPLNGEHVGEDRKKGSGVAAFA